MQKIAPVIREGIGAFQTAVAEALDKASVNVDIYSHELNRDVFGTDLICEALVRWIRHQPRACIRVYIHQAQTAMYRGNPLIELGLKLTSYFQFREPVKNIPMLGEMLIIDGRNLIRRSISDPGLVECWQGVCPAVTAAQQSFDEYWQEGQPSQNIKNLNL